MNPLHLLTMAMMLTSPTDGPLDIQEERKRLHDKSAFGVSGKDLLDQAAGMHRMWAHTLRGEILPVQVAIEAAEQSATWLYAPTGDEPAELDALMVPVMVTLTGAEDRFQLTAQGTLEKNADQPDQTTELTAQVLSGELAPDGIVMQLLPEGARDVFLSLQATVEGDQVRRGQLHVSYARLIDGEEERFQETLLMLSAFSMA